MIRKNIFRKKKPPYDFEAERREAEEKLRKVSAELKNAEFLDLARFDLDCENRFCKGFAAVTESLIISLAESGDKKRCIVIPFEEIESIVMRSEFGVYAAEALRKDGSSVILCRATMRVGKLFIGFFKRAELYLTDKDVYARRKAEPPSVCPKCGKPLPPGSTSCDKCADKMQLIKRVLDIAVPHKSAIAIVTLIYMLTLAVSMVEPYINRVLVDGYINNSDAKLLAVSEPLKVIVPFAITVLMLLVAYLVSWGIGLLRNMIMMKMGLEIVVDLRTKLYDKVQLMSIERVSKRTTGELMNRISDDTSMVQNFVNSWIPNFLGQVLLLLLVGGILIWYDPVLMIIFLVPMPATLVAIYLFNRKIRKIYGKQWEASSRSSAALHDIFSGIRVVKAFGTEEKESVRYGAAATKERDLSIRNELLFAKMQPFIRFGLLLGNFILLYYTGEKILGLKLTIGEATMISTYVSMVYGPLGWLANFPSTLARTLTSANRIFEVLDEKIDIDNIASPVERVIDGNVTFENVCFGYDETQQVLKNVNLNIKPGEMVGLVGRSGVGKSTLINLMMRLYDVESGSIKIDGIDIKDYSQECLRSQVGVVLQETILFSGSLYDNIAYAKENASKEEVLSAGAGRGSP